MLDRKPTIRFIMILAVQFELLYKLPFHTAVKRTPNPCTYGLDPTAVKFQRISSVVAVPAQVMMEAPAFLPQSHLLPLLHDYEVDL